MPELIQKFAYPPVIVDGEYGKTIKVQINRNNLIQRLMLYVDLGSLNGGSSPSWTVSNTNPIITHIRFEADNEVFVDADVDLIYEATKLAYQIAEDGKSVRVDLTDIDFVNSNNVDGTEFPAFGYNNIYLYLTIAPLSQITTGNPSSSTNTTLYITEYASVYSQEIPLAKCKKLQANFNLNNNGANVVTPSPVYTLQGGYKLVLYRFPNDTSVYRMKLIINGDSTIFDDYYSTRRNENAHEFNSYLSSGFVVDSYMPSADDPAKLLVLLDPSIIRTITQEFHTNASNVAVRALKFIYTP